MHFSKLKYIPNIYQKELILLNTIHTSKNKKKLRGLTLKKPKGIFQGNGNVEVHTFVKTQNYILKVNAFY